MATDVSELLALADDLKAAGGKVRYQVAKAVADTTEQVRAAAEARAPRRTGTLAGSITGSARGLRGTVEATARYAEFVEYGTYKDEPQPFMAPAADEADRSFPPDVEAAVVKALGL